MSSTERTNCILFCSLSIEKNDRQGTAAGMEQGLESLNMGEHLPLVVDRPTSIEVAVPLRGLKRRRKPLVQRVRRLDVVMAVGQAGRLPGGMQPISINQRVTGGFDDPDIFEANARQLGGQALGGPADVTFVLGKRRNGRDTE